MLQSYGKQWSSVQHYHNAIIKILVRDVLHFENLKYVMVVKTVQSDNLTVSLVAAVKFSYLVFLLVYFPTSCLLSYSPVVKWSLLISVIHRLQWNVFFFPHWNENKLQCRKRYSVLWPDISEYEETPLYLGICPLGSSWWSRLRVGWEQWEPRHT